MPPKKEEPEALSPPPPMEETEETAEPEITKRCFRVGGQVYYGDCMVGTPGSFVRHGFGRQYTKGKKVSGEEITLNYYEGEWENDLMHGQGSFKWADGSSYEGSFHSGEMHGFGRYEWPEGSAYDGAWVRGQMSGQGQFDSRFDGSYMNGRFQRDCFHQLDGSWVDVRLEHARAEKRSIAKGDASAISIRRCAEHGSLLDILNGVLDEGLVPFLVSDTSLVEPTTAPASSCNIIEPASTVHVREAAVLRRRRSDWRKPFYEAMQAALLGERKWLMIIFDDDVEDGLEIGTAAATAVPGVRGSPPQGDRRAGDASPSTLPATPESWRLEHFMDESALPLEAFHPKLFNGRQLYMPFLKKELQDELEANLEAAGAFSLPALEQTGEAVPEDDSGAVVMDSAMSTDAAAAAAAAAATGAAAESPVTPSTEALVPMKVYFLRFALTAMFKLPPGLTDDQVRDHVLRRYGTHAPLHRTAVVLLTAANPKSDSS
eukprot:TRINITY_DN74234_c0_g1_i1.p1 TRINITY_DN74234_c0_g1~~TRINITY_DN74234_c0_g1_i1.p1  ORF type:complete len:537 (-),score=87.32 TRINITY_DN74234_c0_g1_i1:240-1703(-)